MGFNCLVFEWRACHNFDLHFRRVYRKMLWQIEPVENLRL